MRRQHKSLIKRKRVKDKDDQDGRPSFVITTNANVWEVCVVKGGGRAREISEAEDKGRRYKR